MLPINYRLKKDKDFEVLIKNGKWLKSNNFSVKYLELKNQKELKTEEINKNNFEKPLKIAFSVGLKISKSSVERNRIKRLLREAVRQILKEENLEDGYHLMFVPQQSIKDKNLAQIKEEIKLLLINNNLIKNKSIKPNIENV